MKKKVTTNARTREIKPRITYSDDLLETILDRVAMGESLSSICDADNMPTRKSFFEWVAKDSEIKAKYEFAIQMRADLYANETVAIADEIVIEAKYQGEEVRLDISSSSVARNKLRIDARKWLAGKMAPKKYGDKLDITSTVTVTDLSDEELDAKIAALQAQLK